MEPIQALQFKIPGEMPKKEIPVAVVAPKLGPEGIAQAGAQLQVVNDMKKSAVKAKEDASHADGAVAFDVSLIQNWAINNWPSLIATNETMHKAIAQVGLGPTALHWVNCKATVTSTTDGRMMSDRILAQREKGIDRRNEQRKQIKCEILEKELKEVKSESKKEMAPQAQKVHWKPRRPQVKHGEPTFFTPFHGSSLEAIVAGVSAAAA